MREACRKTSPVTLHAPSARSLRLLAWTAAMAILLCLAAGAVVAQDEDEGDQPAAPEETAPASEPLVEAREDLKQAKKLGAKRHLPLSYRTLDDRLRQAEKDSVDLGQQQALLREARRLLNQATYVDEMRRQQSALEAMLGQFDQSLREIGTLYEVTFDSELSGRPAARDLSRQLEVDRIRRRVMVDSLTIANRFLQETVGGRAAVQESTITAMQVEVSELRRLLWETELRVGVAEADRSAVESALASQQQRDEAIAAIVDDLGPNEGEVLLTATGDVIVRVFGFNFGIGSAQLAASQTALVDKLVVAVQRFPGQAIRVEGHTDDTGTRQANLRLSRRRADTVASLMAKKLDVEVGTILTVGHGPDRPIAPNSTAAGRARNRRIDVVIEAN